MEDNKNQKEPAGCVIIGISFLIPIVGLVLYFAKKEDTINPESYLWAAIIGFVFNIILMVSI